MENNKTYEQERDEAARHRCGCSDRRRFARSQFIDGADWCKARFEKIIAELKKERNIQDHRIEANEIALIKVIPEPSIPDDVFAVDDGRGNRTFFKMPKEKNEHK